MAACWTSSQSAFGGHLQHRSAGIARIGVSCGFCGNLPMCGVKATLPGAGSPTTWGRTNEFSEDRRQMALVRKTDPIRDLRNAQFSAPQQVFGLFDAKVKYVLVRR